MIVEDHPTELAPPLSPTPVSPESTRPDPRRGRRRYTTGVLRWRSPVPRHRRLGLPGIGSVLGALVLVVAVLAVGVRIVDSQLDDDERFREFVSSGEPGEPVSARTFKATVLGVRTAAVLDDGEFLHDTAGVWLLVRVRAVAQQEPATIGYAAARDSRDRVYDFSDRIEQPLVDYGHTLQPGVPVEGDVVFEVPKDATGLTLRLADSNVDLRLTAVAEIVLPAEAEPAGEDPVPIEQPQVVIPDQPVLDGDPGRGE